MSHNENPCNPQRIQQLLSGTLTSAEQEQLERHLDTCESCRRTLHEQASDDVHWQAAANHLSDDNLDNPGRASNSKGSPVAVAIENEVGTISASEIFATDPASAVVIRQIVGWLDPTDDPRMLGRVGHYEIAGVIGAGGMGVVLKGFDASLNRFVAIKLLAPHLAGNGASRQRFAREAQAAAAVVHENVIAIHSVSDFKDLPYLVMPFVRGMSLQKRLDEHGPLDVAEILRIGRQTASGLAAAHAQGLVHRDIKPANILLTDGVSRVTITDFGLARAADDASLTHSGAIAGTPQYMSPEQASGQPVDHRSDLFSLGSVLYALCAGRPPFRAHSAYGVLKRIAEEEARPLLDINASVPAWLGWIIGRLHARNPDDRFQSAEEVDQLLGECLAHLQQPHRVALPEKVRSLSRASGRRTKTMAWVTVIAMTVITALSIGPAIRAWQAPKENAGKAVEESEPTSIKQLAGAPATAEPVDEKVLAEAEAGVEVAETVSTAVNANSIRLEIQEINQLLEQLDQEIALPAPEVIQPVPFPDDDFERDPNSLGRKFDE